MCSVLIKLTNLHCLKVIDIDFNFPFFLLACCYYLYREYTFTFHYVNRGTVTDYSILPDSDAQYKCCICFKMRHRHGKLGMFKSHGHLHG